MKERIKRGIRISRFVLYKETLIDFREHTWSFAGSFAAIGCIGLLNKLSVNLHDYVFLIGSFGASSVLVYGAIQSPLAQPRNLVGGHVLSALIGVTVYKLFPDLTWLAAPLAVSLSIVGMQMTRTMHPPGGATALIAVAGSAQVKALGYLYVLTPVFSGAMILLLFALVFNNLTRHRSYPTSKKFTRTLRKIRMYTRRIKNRA
ncbi:HPP family protein [Pedobacter yulinensis]|uniref:HPP family protein n=1 Tax=Pedobacter yulinensis TaxID=2126353 RepID=A0A2T3HHK2_9SPHI|nr:HPP family protein [Pedobacter yulinensis]PST81919.1 HPP family protein [Pedobacter yulinensis]